MHRLIVSSLLGILCCVVSAVPVAAQEPAHKPALQADWIELFGMSVRPGDNPQPFIERWLKAKLKVVIDDQGNRDIIRFFNEDDIEVFLFVRRQDRIASVLRLEWMGLPRAAEYSQRLFESIAEIGSDNCFIVTDDDGVGKRSLYQLFGEKGLLTEFGYIDGKVTQLRLYRTWMTPAEFQRYVLPQGAKKPHQGAGDES